MPVGTPVLQPAPPGETVYEYQTPDGESDIFFMYGFDASANSLVNGQTYMQLGIRISTGGFVCRAWNGAYTILQQSPLGSLQIYDASLRQWFNTPTICYTANPTAQAAGLIPEVEYPVNSEIRFDLMGTAVRTV